MKIVLWFSLVSLDDVVTSRDAAYEFCQRAFNWKSS